MSKYFLTKVNQLLFFAFFVTCLPVLASAENTGMSENEYLPGNNSTVGIILCHGRGKYPTWFVVEPLRTGINSQLGYHTLSIQMPTDDISWRDYKKLFPEAHKQITKAIQYLKNKKGVNKVFLLGHSMGARMVTSYLASHPDSGITGFIGVGIRNGGGIPLDSNRNLRLVRVPVLDVYGDGGDGKDKAHAIDRAGMVSPRYTQILVSGASHKFTRHEDELVSVVSKWLLTQSSDE